MFMKFLKPMFVAGMGLVISLGFYMLFASEKKLPSINSSYSITGSTGASRSIDRLAQDVIPEPLLYSFDPLTNEELYVHDNDLRADAANFEVRAGEIDENYFPYYQDGAIYPPKKYDVENNYSEQDIEKMKRALKIAHRYADVNYAIEDGYRVVPSYSLGMGIHFDNINYIVDDEVTVEKPEFLTYIRNNNTGRYQLAQMGFIAQRTTPYKLFDAPEARGHFHIGRICMREAKEGPYIQITQVSRYRNKEGEIIGDGAIRDSTIFQELGLEEVIENTPAECVDTGGRQVDSIWMMHFAINMYNERGMFADVFPYVDYLSNKKITHSFYGEKIDDAEQL